MIEKKRKNQSNKLSTTDGFKINKKIYILRVIRK